MVGDSAELVKICDRRGNIGDLGFFSKDSDTQWFTESWLGCGCWHQYDVLMLTQHHFIHSITHVGFKFYKCSQNSSISNRTVLDHLSYTSFSHFVPTSLPQWQDQLYLAPCRSVQTWGSPSREVWKYWVKPQVPHEITTLIPERERVWATPPSLACFHPIGGLWSPPCLHPGHQAPFLRAMAASQHTDLLFLQGGSGWGPCYTSPAVGLAQPEECCINLPRTD